MSRGRGNLAAMKGAMRSEYFLASERLGFRAWRNEDLPLAMELWTDVRVTGLFGGPYTPDRVCGRLEREMATQLEKLQLSLAKTGEKATPASAALKVSSWSSPRAEPSIV